MEARAGVGRLLPREDEAVTVYKYPIARVFAQQHTTNRPTTPEEQRFHEMLKREVMRYAREGK